MTQTEKPKRKPTQLSDFQGLTQIGHGAFGTVYKAVHKNAKKAFALKKISKKEVKSQNMISQLNNEIKISRQLDHPNIIKLYDTFDNGEDIYLVLELAQNGQLFSKIVREGKLDEKTAKQMIKQVLEAVSYLHSRDPPIIHRDIKPENILLDKNNRVKLADFGWSNFLNKPRKTYCGTFDYLAPEMIDKSGHDQKLDIWCLGVLAYELLTGRTPFVVQGPKQETKKMIQQNILDVNVTFPNDFPILAKSFILGMIKRKPQQRLTLKEIMNHEWLTATVTVEKPFLQPIEKEGVGKHMQKKPLNNIPLLDAQQGNIIDSLNKRIRQLQQQNNRLKVNERVMAQQSKGMSNNAEYNALMKELRKLRGIEQKNLQLQQDNEKYWGEINKKDKDIIELRAQVKALEENQETIEKLKHQKNKMKEKLDKAQKQIKNLENKKNELESQLSSFNSTLGAKLNRGDKITLAEANSKEYLELIQQEMETLESAFQDSKKVLLKVLAKEKTAREKEDQLIRLRTEKARLREELRAELKEEFQQQKDQIILQARSQLACEKEKWLTERAELKKFYDQQSTQIQSHGVANAKQELELQIRTLRELVGFHEATINQLQIKLRQFEEQGKRKR